MEKHKEITIGLEERLHRAARIFATAAIRAVPNGHMSVSDGEIDTEGCVTGRRAEGAAANPTPQSTDASAIDGMGLESRK